MTKRLKRREIMRDALLEPIALGVSSQAVYAAAYYRVTYEQKIGKVMHITSEIERGHSLHPLAMCSSDVADKLMRFIRIAAECADVIRRECWALDERIAKKSTKRRKRAAR